MQSTFYCYITKSPIDMNETLTRSTAYIIKMMKYPKSFVSDEMRCKI